MSGADPAALARTTAELCEIPSVTGAEEAICSHVQERLRRLGAGRGSLVRHGHSLVLRPRRRDGRPLVLLLGHLDTVPPRQDRPVNIRDGWLEGCGASDMKSGLAVMIHLAEELPVEASEADIGLVFYEREEGPLRESSLGHLLERESMLREADLAVMLEPTDGVVELGCVGSLHATLRFGGKRAHSARPWEGVNAVHAAGPLLCRLRDLPPREVEVQGLVFRETAQVTIVTGTGTRNVVPDRLELNLNYRFAPGKPPERAVQDVAELVEGAASIEVTDLAPAGRVCLDNALARALARRTGAAPRPKQAWTDVAQMTAAGVDAVNFGPGSGPQAHQQNEGVSVAAIARCYEMMSAWLRELS